MVAPFVKDPDSVIDFSVNWDDGYLQSGETITTSTWTVEPFVSTDLDIQSSSNTSEVATAWITGGTRGNRYRLTNRIVTADGRTDERSITIFVRPE